MNEAGRFSDSIGANKSAMLFPKITSASVLPISVVPINFDGFCIKYAMILPDQIPDFPCISTCKRLADRKAISIPEKKKEKTSEVIIQG